MMMCHDYKAKVVDESRNTLRNVVTSPFYNYNTNNNNNDSRNDIVANLLFQNHTNNNSNLMVPPMWQNCGDRRVSNSSWEFGGNQTTNEEKQYLCESCDKRFTDPSNLQRHIRQQHLGARAHPCPECGKTFATSSGLKQHQHIHSSVKPFTCGVCQKSYTQFSNLCRHKRMHSDCRTQIKCRSCGQNFPNASSLNKHRRFCESKALYRERHSFEERVKTQVSNQHDIVSKLPMNNHKFINPFIHNLFPLTKNYNLSNFGYDNRVGNAKLAKPLSINVQIQCSNPSVDPVSPRGFSISLSLPKYTIGHSKNFKPSTYEICYPENTSCVAVQVCDNSIFLEEPNVPKNNIPGHSKQVGLSHGNTDYKQSSNVFESPISSMQDMTKRFLRQQNGEETQNSPKYQSTIWNPMFSPCRSQISKPLSSGLGCMDQNSLAQNIFLNAVMRSRYINSLWKNYANIMSTKISSQSVSQIEKDCKGVRFQRNMMKTDDQPLDLSTSLKTQRGVKRRLSCSEELSPSSKNFLPNSHLRTCRDFNSSIPVDTQMWQKRNQFSMLQPNLHNHYFHTHLHPSPVFERSFTNTKSERYSCKYCGKVFPRSANLTRHLRTHTGEQPYRCKYCERSFSISSNLQRHVRNIHNKERPYTCNLCGRAFSQQTNLERHLKQHSEAKNEISFEFSEEFPRNSTLLSTPVNDDMIHNARRVNFHTSSPKLPEMNSSSELSDKDDAYFDEIGNFIENKSPNSSDNDRSSNLTASPEKSPVPDGLLDQVSDVELVDANSRSNNVITKSPISIAL